MARRKAGLVRDARALRADLQRAFDPTSESGGVELLSWFLFTGMDELDLEREDTPDGVRIWARLPPGIAARYAPYALSSGVSTAD